MIPTSRTELGESAFSFHTLQAWNVLQGIVNLECLPSLYMFKKYVKICFYRTMLLLLTSVITLPWFFFFAPDSCMFSVFMFLICFCDVSFRFIWNLYILFIISSFLLPSWPGLPWQKRYCITMGPSWLNMCPRCKGNKINSAEFCSNPKGKNNFPITTIIMQNLKKTAYTLLVIGYYWIICCAKSKNKHVCCAQMNLTKRFYPRPAYLRVSLMKGVVLLLELCFSLLKSADCIEKETHTITQSIYDQMSH